MAKKKVVRSKPTPIVGRAISPFELAAEMKQKAEEAEKYVKETGLCYNCKKNKADPDGQCGECKEETEKILRQLRGPGFVEMKIGKNNG